MTAPGTAPPARSRRPARVALALAAVLGAAVVVRTAYRAEVPKPQPAADPLALPPLPASPFLNAGPDARYVGSDSCLRCHAARHESFRHSGMGRSMAEASAGREPPDGAFDHPASRRRYEVRRRDGRVWHRELLLADGPEVLLAEHPVKYVVGSGRHSLTYLCEAEGFLVESPVTWYASKRAWAMSPGYDDPKQPGFQRGIGTDCLFCHAGRAGAVEKSMHRMKVVEAAIGCERCHGPGSLHTARHEGPGRAGGEFDDTIVNPRRLPRELAEAVCQQCHLRPAAVVPARGRKLSDFRPGLPLSDFVHPYLPDSPGASMTVTGHVEQMHASRCYQRSGTLTCLTCHTPHDEPPAGEFARYNSACLTCHAPPQRGCAAPEERRKEGGAADDCVRCHMPRSPTEIPHLAFTHHRIGVHTERPAEGAPDPAELRPFFDLSRWGELDRKRSLGLAYLEAVEGAKEPGAKADYQRRAFDLLSAVRAAGMRDAILDARLAQLCDATKQGDAGAYAESALDDPELAGLDRCNAIAVLASARFARGQAPEALSLLRDLTRARRQPIDWLLVAECEQALGRPAAAEEAMAAAVRINPRLWPVHKHLADFYRRRGDEARAEWHRLRAEP